MDHVDRVLHETFPDALEFRDFVVPGGLPSPTRDIVQEPVSFYVGGNSLEYPF